MNVLVLGSGGREHALAWSLAASPLLSRLYAAPGNPGIAALATCLAVDPMDFAAVIAASRQYAIDLVVVGPEVPLCAGLVDRLAAAGIKAFGPTAAAARLEGSKGFTKDLCRRHGIPTAAYARFARREDALDHVARRPLPLVVKADGLAAGKGVTLCATRVDAAAAVEAAFDGRFGEAGAEVVVEDMLEGEEASIFALVDGVTALPFSTAQDHKRVGDGDTGPNTGGMGAYSPAPVMTPAMTERVFVEIIRPTVAAMAAEGAPFRGMLYAGVMITDEGPKLIEYNVRLGDPEAQVLLPRLKSDLLTLLLGTVDGVLAGMDVRWHARAALTVVLATRGYPGSFPRGSVISGLSEAEALADVTIFQAGTALRNGALVADGGRVLAVTAQAKTVAAAQALAYKAVDRIKWPEGFCRRDIGWRALEREARQQSSGLKLGEEPS